MASIHLHDAEVEIPILNADSRSLKNKLVSIASGGRLHAHAQGHVTVHALKNLNLTILDGERVGLVGGNGSGKTTLLRLLSGVYAPTQGQVHRLGQVASLIAISLGIDAEATGRENIFLRGAILGMSRKEISAKVEEIINFSELGEFIDLPVRTYSSGMHMRLAFAVSTVIRPEILLMDEWLSVGDEGFKQKAEARLSDMVQSTKILVIASHSKDLIQNTCSRVLWLENGTIKLDGPPEEVCAGYFSSRQ